MSIRTLDVDVLADKVGTIYEATVILSRRARQIATHQKTELQDVLSRFSEYGSETDDIHATDEQLRASLEYERRKKPTELAIEEMFSDEIYHRYPANRG